MRAAQQVEDEFPELFNGLSCLTDNYKIQLIGNAQPLAITTTPRWVAIIPLLPKVKAELYSEWPIWESFLLLKNQLTGVHG